MTKRNLLTIAILVLSVLFVNAQSSRKIDFEHLVHDFGKIKEEDGKAIHKFKFNNNGKIPIIIRNVESTCGCTTPEWTKTPVLPGKSGFINVAFDPHQRPGAFSKQVKIFNNVTASPVVLEIKGVVIQKTKKMEDIYRYQLGSMRLKSRYIAFARITNTQSKTQSVDFINNSNETINVSVDEKALRSYLKVKIEPAQVAPKGKGVITVTYDPRNEKSLWGYNTAGIPIKINGQKAKGYPLSVSATVVEDFSKLTKEQLANAPSMDFQTKIFNFGTMKSGEKVTHAFKFKNNGGSDLIIRRIKTSCGCTAVETKRRIKPGESSEIKVVFNSKGKHGRQNKRIDLTVNVPGENGNGASKSSVVLIIHGQITD